MSTASAIYVRVPQELLQEFDRVAQEHGLSRSEAIREAMKLFIYYSKAPDVKKLRGIIEADIEAEEIDKFVLPG
ncbi:MAG TPA: ribbon-helix-helix protein, CopG family [Pyrodictium delaneyi]|uniref:Ribbon-helix-helix protein, CopG family n=1 Tax=Pyrodictium delaneyi TaxID=1273541 RepID=A0A832ZS74_9CREN|nr:ribbon-helix-helix protein, CopG family [Pyrodictium delaneyi]